MGNVYAALVQRADSMHAACKQCCSSIAALNPRNPHCPRTPTFTLLVTQFVTDLAKDPKKLPRSINFKRVHMMLNAKEKMVTRVLLEFLNVIPVFEQFLLLFQRASPVIHIMYDSMCDILVRLLRRFMKGQAVKKRYGSDLTSIECQDVKLQLPDMSIVIGKGAREALVKLTSEQQRQALLGIRSFMCTTATELQQNCLLRMNY